MLLCTSLTSVPTVSWTVRGGLSLQGNAPQAGACVLQMGEEEVEHPLQAVDRMATSALTDRMDHPF